MSFSFKLLSHKNKLLKTHLRNVGKLSAHIIKAKQIKEKELFSDISFLIGISHDFGKATSAFQRKLTEDYYSKYANHGFISSLFGSFLVKNFLNRKEKYEEFNYLPFIAWLVILRHHGNINNLRGYNGELSKLKNALEVSTLKKQIKMLRENFEELKQIYRDFLGVDIIEDFFKLEIEPFMQEIFKIGKSICREKNIKYYFYILFLYSVLLDADKIDASEINHIPPRIQRIPQDIVDNYKKKMFKAENQSRINQLRENAYNEICSNLNNLNIDNNKIFCINLPTGMGKTLSGISFAIKLRKKVKAIKDFVPKIIYSLPFLSIIDQNSEVIQDILQFMGKEIIPSNLFLKHHYLSDIEYIGEERDENYNELELRQSLLLTEGWHSEIIITTFVQLFHSLITNNNRLARKFNNISNSIIILDEIQAISYKYWLIINRVLKYLSYHLNCWIILMTATMPLLFDKNEIFNLIESSEMYYGSFDRVEFNFQLNKLDLDTFKKKLLKKIFIEKDKNIMVVLNTINSCKKVYQFLKQELCEQKKVKTSEFIDQNGILIINDLELINLSTHILPSYRLLKINNINKRKRRKIIITTQLIEAGVDISVDIIYRDFAPLDSLIQTAGRCNRNNSPIKGKVYVIYLIDENSRPFCSYIYHSTLLNITKEVIDNFRKKEVEKSFIYKASHNYYSLLRKRGTEDDSIKIIESLKLLNFKDTTNFQLIEEIGTNISVFVEINEEAKAIREQLERFILKENIKPSNKSNLLLMFRKELNDNSLSIRCNKKMEEHVKRLPKLGKMENYRYINKKDLNKWYKLDTGFIT